jgi:DNA polymerase-3 subunit delta'
MALSAKPSSRNSPRGAERSGKLAKTPSRISPRGAAGDAAPGIRMKKFRDIYGQKEIIAHLQNALRTGRISHAYIISGESGSGKEELARIFAATLQCTDRQEENGFIEACGQCRSCIHTEAMDQPDIITMHHVPNYKGDASTNLSVNDIRRMRDDVGIKPYSGSWKVYILPNAEKMTVQAQNALLKTLEEPPAYAVVILLCSGMGTLLPTILSRCILLKMEPVPDAVLEKMLKEKGVGEERALLCARLSHGNPGRAQELSQSDEFWQFRTKTVSFLNTLEQRDAAEIVAFSADFADRKKTNSEERKKEEAGGEFRPCTEDFLDIFQSWLGDILRYKSTGDADGLIFQDSLQYIMDIAGRTAYDRLEGACRAFDTAMQRRHAGGNDAQILEMLLLDARECLRGGRTSTVR